jgi:hypothetical protein
LGSGRLVRQVSDPCQPSPRGEIHHYTTTRSCSSSTTGRLR